MNQTIMPLLSTVVTKIPSVLATAAVAAAQREQTRKEVGAGGIRRNRRDKSVYLGVGSEEADDDGTRL